MIINSCGITDCAPDWSWITADNGFDDYDLWAVFRGKGEIRTASEIFAVSTGSCMLLAPGKKYIGNHDPLSPLFVTHVHFSILENGKNVSPWEVQQRHIADTAFLGDLLNHVITFFYRNETEKASFWLNAALYEFLTSNATENLTSAYIGVNEKKVFEICDQINTSAETAPKLSEFAKQLGYSETYLGKLFHKIIGVTFSEYVANAKINKAKFLIRSSDYTINYIAEILSYYDTSFFIRQFKKHTGISPGKYRKHNK